MLKKRIPNSPHKIDYKDLESRDDMSYIEKPVKILHRKKKQCWGQKPILMVKVLWKNHGLKEVTWELEFDIKEKYPEPFE